MSFAERALAYADGVIAGDIVACEYVNQACKRFISDFENHDFYFDADAAHDACWFLETLTHTKGRWAAKGETIRLEDWQVFVIANIFGWKRKKDDLRRFREVYIEVPRKNGKSILAAGVGLYMFARDGEFGAEIYSGATTEKQAWEVFRPAKIMCQRNEDFCSFYDIEVNAKNLNILSSGSKFEPLIGNPGDGASPSCAIVDEYHEHDKPDLFETMETGMGAREQPIMFVITTSGSNFGGPCYEKRGDIIKILNRNVVDESVFGVIYTLDENDDWDSVESLKKANPNFGVSVSSDFLVQQLDKARRSATKQNSFKTKHLNLWVGARTSWMNMLAWQRQQKALNIEDFKGEKCHIAVDLASKKDVAAISMIFERDGNKYHFGRYYAPEGAAEVNDKYREYEASGHLTLTPGNATDYGYIEEELKRIYKDFDVSEIAFDPFQAQYLMQRMQYSGVEVIEYGQTVRNMSDPMKEMEAEILDGRFFHDGNPVMTWMVGNVVARKDAKDNIFPRKENENSESCKIDGAVAAIMAMGRALMDREQPNPYKDRGILVL